jgi:hypothetical protein
MDEVLAAAASTNGALSGCCRAGGGGACVDLASTGCDTGLFGTGGTVGAGLAAALLMTAKLGTCSAPWLASLLRSNGKPQPVQNFSLDSSLQPHSSQKLSKFFIFHFSYFKTKLLENSLFFQV